MEDNILNIKTQLQILGCSLFVANHISLYGKIKKSIHLIYEKSRVDLMEITCQNKFQLISDSKGCEGIFSPMRHNLQTFRYFSYYHVWSEEKYNRVFSNGTFVTGSSMILELGFMFYCLYFLQKHKVFLSKIFCHAFPMLRVSSILGLR